MNYKFYNQYEYQNELSYLDFLIKIKVLVEIRLKIIIKTKKFSKKWILCLKKTIEYSFMGRNMRGGFKKKIELSLDDVMKSIGIRYK